MPLQLLPTIPKIQDYWATKWPADLRIDDGSVAEELDKLNASGRVGPYQQRCRGFIGQW
jgi:hypothetical protein